MGPLNQTFAALVDALRTDPGALGMVLTGSRGKGFADEDSDWDFLLIVTEPAAARLQAQLRAQPPAFDGHAMTLEAFAAHAAWGSPMSWARYDFAHLTPAWDRTGGRLASLLDEKARVPVGHRDAFIAASLDHVVNQVYRAIKCAHRGDGLACHLEAVEGLSPLLDAWFALDGGRLRPYPKYLAWELRTHPVAGLPWQPAAMLGLIGAVLQRGDVPAQQALLAETLSVFRKSGYGDVFDGWRGRAEWCVSWRPGISCL